MNAAVRTLQVTPISRVSIWEISSTSYLTVVSLIMAVLLSSLSLIYVKDMNRRLMGELQMQQTARSQLHAEWSQLLLEQGTWSAQTRIQRVAMTQLNMDLPRSKSILIVS